MMAMLSIFVLMSVVGIGRVGSAGWASIAVRRASLRRTWLIGQSFATDAVTPVTPRPSGLPAQRAPGCRRRGPWAVGARLSATVRDHPPEPPRDRDGRPPPRNDGTGR